MRSIVLITFTLMVGACHSPTRPPSYSSVPRTMDPPRRPSSGVCTQAEGEELYKVQAYPEATWVFAEVLAGRCPLGVAGSHDRTEFWLAKSRYQTADYSGSLELLRAIAGNPQHEYHLLALAWLATLTRVLDDPGPALEAIGWYPPEALDDAAFDMIHDELDYLYGHYMVSRGDARAGERHLAAVPLDSDYAIIAHFELGELRWREGNIPGAIAAYQTVLAVWAAQEQARAEYSRRDRRVPEPPEVEQARIRLRSQGFAIDPPRRRR